jgi:transposase InsO family protein
VPGPAPRNPPELKWEAVELYLILDACSRKVVGWSMSSTITHSVVRKVSTTTMRGRFLALGNRYRQADSGEWAPSYQTFAR